MLFTERSARCTRCTVGIAGGRRGAVGQGLIPQIDVGFVVLWEAEGVEGFGLGDRSLPADNGWGEGGDVCHKAAEAVPVLPDVFQDRPHYCWRGLGGRGAVFG